MPRQIRKTWVFIWDFGMRLRDEIIEINLILQPPIPGFPGISTYIDRTHYLGLSLHPGRSSDIWRELKNLATTESNTSYIGTSNTLRSRETWSWDLMRLGLIESHENSHLTRVILEKISISRKHMRWDWDPTLKKTPAARGLEELFKAVLERFLKPIHDLHLYCKN